MLTRILQSEWLKLKRTSLRWVVFAFFIAYSILMVWFSGNLFQYNNIIFEMYQAFFALCGILIPICLSIYIGMINLLEKNAGNFRNVIGSPFGKIKIFICKNILVNIVFSLSIVLSTTLFLSGINIFYNLTLPINLFLIGMVCICFSCISLSAVYITISFCCSIGTVVAIGIFSSLTAAIFLVAPIGNVIWWIIPFTNPAILPIVCFQNLHYLLMICIVITVLTFIFMLWFFKKME